MPLPSRLLEGSTQLQRIATPKISTSTSPTQGMSRKLPFICRRCAFRHYSSQPSAQQLPPPPPASGIARLTNRRLVSVHGSDAPRFLQGLTTNNVRPQQSSGWYSAFLTAQGRVLWDVFIYPTAWSTQYREWLSRGSVSQHADDPAYLIEVDAGEADALAQHLKRHKLRSKVSIRPVDAGEWEVWAAWRKEDKWTPHYASFDISATAKTVEGIVTGTASEPTRATPVVPDANDPISITDGRAPGLCQRLLVPDKVSVTAVLPSSSELEEASLSSYTLRRILHGVAEGPTEITRGTALPLESNIDYMGGLDFRKGCYVGQELTIRTHHTGVVRKRILPVMLYAPGESSPQELRYTRDAELPIPRKDADIMGVGGGRKRSAGRWLGGVGNVGLALCRLAAMTDQSVTAEGGDWNSQQEFEIRTGGDGDSAAGAVRVKAFVPEWHVGKSRVRAPPRRPE